MKNKIFKPSIEFSKIQKLNQSMIIKKYIKIQYLTKKIFGMKKPKELNGFKNGIKHITMILQMEI